MDVITPDQQAKRLREFDREAYNNLIRKYRETGKQIYLIELNHRFGAGDYIEGDDGDGPKSETNQ